GQNAHLHPVNCAFSPIFALSNLRSSTFRTAPRPVGKVPADLAALNTGFMIERHQIFAALIGAEAVAKTTAAI
ncbi:hypothetical protein, partial [Halomonas sp.]|uniref:hypothetical protein n=1 Tax=Halomonas sp. TaxID=1486246 RepID=UPI002579F1CD